MSHSSKGSLQHWQVLGQKDVFEYQGIRLTLQSVRLPDGRVIEDYLQVAMRSFALVFAETADHLVLCFRQYRHGPRRVGLALPGGGIGPDETPAEAAQRELLEETGYASKDWRELGRLAVNGNQGCGECFVFRATVCTKVSEPAPDDIEEMRLEPLTREQLLVALAAGEFTVASHVAAVGLGLLTP
jgi:ADP-ribose pyrophosphatase